MRLAAQGGHSVETVQDPLLKALSYDDYRHIRFREERARGASEKAPFHVSAFHLGWLYGETVRIFEVKDGQAQEIGFSTDDFEYLGDLATRLPEHYTLPGVSGFRINYALNAPSKLDELITFQGASYFRALGRHTAYGLSARGLAVNTGSAAGEEFPRFSRFYIERPNNEIIIVHAALESASLTGAYRFVIQPGQNTVMDVTARLFLRKDIEILGVAPLTSMFLYSEKNRAHFDDYRPNVHDSDGLQILRADGDVLWRPLNNPPRLSASFFAEERPAAFGLMQRDRDFANYQDVGARYEARPSLMIRPKGDWGKGAVQLLEIPTDLETNDNIVAFWRPEAPAKAGDALEFSYEMIWGALPQSHEADLAYVHETRAGSAGASGISASEQDPKGRKFVVDFRGGLLANLAAQDLEVTPVVHISGGDIRGQAFEKIPATGDWRLVLDISATGDAPVELAAHIAGYGRKLSETWLTQWMR